MVATIDICKDTICDLIFEKGPFPTKLLYQMPTFNHHSAILYICGKRSFQKLDHI